MKGTRLGSLFSGEWFGLRVLASPLPDGGALVVAPVGEGLASSGEGAPRAHLVVLSPKDAVGLQMVGGVGFAWREDPRDNDS